jgi:C-terminal processing protease CtpA/Prc
MAAALSFVTGGARPLTGSAPRAAAAANPVWRPDAAYAEMAYPAVEYRLLGVYRFWGIVDYFFPYKHLMSRNWNDALAEFIPKAIAAKDALEYGLVIAEMATWLEDSHVGVDSAAMRGFYGDAVPPLAFRYVENVPIVTRILDESIARPADVAIGDVLVQVDGQAVEARSAELLRFLTVSNPWAARVKLARYIAAGPDGTNARLTFRARDGRTSDVTLPRRTSFLVARPAVSNEPSYRHLDPAIGYVDLTRLTPQDVDRMVDTLQQTTAIIFDMRGYPRGVFAPLGARMNRVGAQYAATFLRPVLSAGTAGMSFTFQQRIPPTARPPYQGKTVMLIDERAISQSEHTGLFLEAASGITFIGSATAGANGDVTRFVLPGGVTVGFTGHDVRHSDGRQLQKVGLTPHVEVSPTIRGIREGKDEVLERALRFVREGS